MLISSTIKQVLPVIVIVPVCSSRAIKSSIQLDIWLDAPELKI